MGGFHKVVRIVTGNTPFLDDVLNVVVSKEVQDIDRFIVTKNNIDEVLQDTQQALFFSPHYIVQVYLTGMRRDDHKKVIALTENVVPTQVIVIADYKYQLEFLTDVDKEITQVEINCYKLSKTFIDSYITKRLSKEVIRSAVSIIRERLKGSYDALDYYIEVLNDRVKEQGSVNEKEIIQMIPTRDVISYQQMFFNLLTESGRKQTYQMLENYRYGIKYLYKAHKRMFYEMEFIYHQYYEGYFNETRIKEWMVEREDMEDRGKPVFSEWALTDILEILKVVSYEVFMDKMLLFITTDMDRYSLRLTYHKCMTLTGTYLDMNTARRK